MGGGYRGAQRRRRCVPEWTARTTVWCRAGWKVSVPGRELSRGVAEGTVLPLGSLAHEVRNLPEPSVALRIPALLKNTQISYLGAVRMPSRTHGSPSSQLGPWRRAISSDLR